MVIITKAAVTSLMVHYLGCSKTLVEATIIRKCISQYGATPDTVLSLWQELEYCGKVPPKGKIIHVLWMFSFLKLYNTYSVLAGMYGVSDNTYSNWVWGFIKAVASLEHLVSSVLYCNSF